MELLKMINIGLRFLLELWFLVIFGYWGFTTGSGTLPKIVLGVGAPILFAVTWGTWLAPKSTTRLSEPWLFLLELVIFVLASGSLFSTGKVNLTIAFGVIYILNKLFMVIWRQ